MIPDHLRRVLAVLAEHQGALTADLIVQAGRPPHPLMGAHTISAIYGAEAQGLARREPGQRWYLTEAGVAYLATPPATEEAARA